MHGQGRDGARALRFRFAGCLALIGGVLWAGAALAQESPRADAGGAGWHVLSDDWTGCVSADAQDRLTDLAASGDRAAYSAYLMEMGLTGQCTVLEEGTEVHLDDASWSGLVCLRPRGSVECLWTLREAVSG